MNKSSPNLAKIWMISLACAFVAFMGMVGAYLLIIGTPMALDRLFLSLVCIVPIIVWAVAFFVASWRATH